MPAIYIVFADAIALAASLAHGREVRDEEVRRTREDGMRDAKVCTMRKFVANFTRLRSEAEERWNRTRPVLWVVPFYLHHKNSSRRRFAANYSPLGKESGKEEGIIR